MSTWWGEDILGWKESISQAAVLADDYILMHKSISGCKPLVPAYLNSRADLFSPSPKPRDRANPEAMYQEALIPLRGIISLFLKVQIANIANMSWQIFGTLREVH